MPIQLEPELQRWVDAKVIDLSIYERIRNFESTRERTTRHNLPAIIAIACGAVMLGAGVLLFVAAHWEEMPPATRFSLVLFLVAVFHFAGTLKPERYPLLSLGLHTLGTLAMGAGIFLTGEIFNLQEHWPTGVLLWAVGAWIGALLLRHWGQFALAAILTPAWLLSEWAEATRNYHGAEIIASEGVLLLAIAYFTSRSATLNSLYRRALTWIGGLALVPAFMYLVFEGDREYYSSYNSPPDLSPALRLMGWGVALGAPLVVSFLLRRRQAWPMLLAVVCVVVQGRLPFYYEPGNDSLAVYAWRTLGPYIWSSAGSIGLIAWGVRDQVKARINMGMALFAFSVAAFYFSDLFDKLGRSVSLIGFGVLFLVGGYFMEKARKRLIAQVEKEAQ